MLVKRPRQPGGKSCSRHNKNATKEINNVAQQIINQIINQEGKEVEKMLPKFLRGAIKDVYQTPFKLLGNFRKQQLNTLKNKTLR